KRRPRTRHRRTPMSKHNHRSGIGGLMRLLERRKIPALIVLCIFSLLATFAVVGSVAPALAAAQAANLDQFRNGGVATPQTFLQCTGAQWVNGNAGASNSHYREGESISYRARVTGLTAGNSVTLIIGYDVIHSGVNAIDYLTDKNRWQPPETTAGATPDQPCSGEPCTSTT